MNGNLDVHRFANLRKRMVDDQLLPRGISDADVIRVMQAVPRELFVPLQHRDHAYADGPLEIGFGQTISQPFVVASMTQSLGLTSASRILEIGTGSGYQTAVLAELGDEVYTIELIPELGCRSRELLTQLGYTNVEFRIADGKLGWPERALFDGILVAAAANKVPEMLLDQLSTGGRLVCPVVADDGRQELRLVQKTSSGTDVRTLYEVRFVPLR